MIWITGFTRFIRRKAPNQSVQIELVEDLIAIVTSFAARLYGRRLQRYRAMKTCLKQVADPSESLKKTQELLKGQDQH